MLQGHVWRAGTGTGAGAHCGGLPRLCVNGVLQAVAFLRCGVARERLQLHRLPRLDRVVLGTPLRQIWLLRQLRVCTTTATLCNHSAQTTTREEQGLHGNDLWVMMHWSSGPAGACQSTNVTVSVPWHYHSS